MEERLKDFLTKNKLDLSTTDAPTWLRGKALNIVEEDGRYNSELKEGAILAGLQWLLTSEQRELTLDVDRAADMAGISRDEVNNGDELIQLMSGGMTATMAPAWLRGASSFPENASAAVCRT